MWLIIHAMDLLLRISTSANDIVSLQREKDLKSITWPKERVSGLQAPVAQRLLHPVRTKNREKHESYQLDRSRWHDRSSGEQSRWSANSDFAFELNAQRAREYVHTHVSVASMLMSPFL